MSFLRVSPNKMDEMVLVGDIGGTKTNLALFVRGKRRPRQKVLKTYDSRESSGLEELIRGFLKDNPCSVSGAAFGIAGPVFKGTSKATNLPWVVSEKQIKDSFGWKHVQLVNDLTGMAYGLLLVGGREFVSLNRGRAENGGNIGLLAPGTGLGVALLVCLNGEYLPVPSEGGHADFSPNSELELDLWRYLHRRFGHVSTERILSGPGLENLYTWLKDSGMYPQPEWLSRRLSEEDPAKVITQTAIDHGQPLCNATLDTFVSILGATAGNLALTGMCTGGLYLGGGIPPKILPRLREGPFLKSFTNKGRFGSLVQKIPVRVILNEGTALLGLAQLALGP